ncbi:MAG: hypothetical protein Q7T11_06570, partial [Deltaproteobacteria bacterium]|nr:hypothetical protein [Deltaproteobacteria bacterium]
SGQIRIGKDGIVESGKITIHGFLGLTMGFDSEMRSDGHHPNRLSFQVLSLRAEKGRIWLEKGGTALLIPAFIWNRLPWSNTFGKMNDKGEIDVTDWIAKTAEMDGLPFQISRLIETFMNRKPAPKPPSKYTRWAEKSLPDVLHRTRFKAEFLFDEPMTRIGSQTIDLKDLVVEYNGLEDISVKSAQVSIGETTAQDISLTLAVEPAGWGYDVHVRDIQMPHIESGFLPALGRLREAANWLKLHWDDSLKLEDGSLGLEGLLDETCTLDVESPSAALGSSLEYDIPYSLECAHAGVRQFLDVSGENISLRGSVHSSGDAAVIHVERGELTHQGKAVILDIAIDTKTVGAPLSIKNLDIVFNPDGTKEINAERVEWALKTFFQSKAFSYLSHPKGRARLMKMRALLDDQGILTVQSYGKKPFFEGEAQTTLTFPSGASFDSDHVHLQLDHLRFDTQNQTAELTGHLHSQSQVPLNRAIQLMEGLKNPEDMAAQARVFGPDGKDREYRVEVKATRMRVTPKGLLLLDNTLKISSPREGNSPIPPLEPVAKLNLVPPQPSVNEKGEEASPATPFLLKALAQAVKQVSLSARLPHKPSSLDISLSQMANHWSNDKLGFDILPFNVAMSLRFPEGALNIKFKTETDPRTLEEKIVAIDLLPEGEEYYPLSFVIGDASMDLGKIGVGIRGIRFEEGKLILDVRHAPDFDLSEFVMKKLGVRKEHFDALGIEIDCNKIIIPTRFYDLRKLIVEAAKVPATEEPSAVTRFPVFDWDKAALALDMALVDSFEDPQRIRTPLDLPRQAKSYPVDLESLKADPAEGSRLTLNKTPESRDFTLQPLGFERLEFDIAEFNRPRGLGLLARLDYTLQNEAYLRGINGRISASSLHLDDSFRLSTRITLDGEEEIPEFKFSGMEGNFGSLRLYDLFFDRTRRPWHAPWPASIPALTVGAAGVEIGGDFKLHEEHSLIDFDGRNIRFNGLEASFFPRLQAYHLGDVSGEHLRLFHPHIALEGLEDVHLSDVTVAFAQPDLGRYGIVTQVPDVYFTAASLEKTGGVLYLKNGEKVPLGGKASTGKIAVRVEDGKILFTVADADIPLGEMPLPFLRQIQFPEGLNFEAMDLKNVRFTGDIQGSFVNRDIILEGDFGIAAEGEVAFSDKNIQYRSGVKINVGRVRRMVIEEGKIVRIEFEDLTIGIEDMRARIALANYFYSRIGSGPSGLVPHGEIKIKRGIIDQSLKGTGQPFVSLHGFELEGELFAQDSRIRGAGAHAEVPKATLRVNSEMVLELNQPTAAQNYDLRLTDYGTDVTLTAPALQAGK